MRMTPRASPATRVFALELGLLVGIVSFRGHGSDQVNVLQLLVDRRGVDAHRFE
jgi:hypothetical protein